MTDYVVITSLHLMHGGIEKAITTLANMLDESGYKVEIFCTYNLGNPVYALNANVKIRYLTDKKPNKDELFNALKSKNPIKIIKETIAAAKILHQKKKTMKQALKAVESGTIISTRHENSKILSKHGSAEVKKIAQLHVDHGFDKKLFADFRTKYSNIDYFVLLTEQSVQEVKKAVGSYNKHTNIVAIPNIVDGPYELPSQKRIKQVISVGRLHRDKDFDSLLEIWSIVATDYPEWKLKIIGGGPLKTSLIEKAKKLGIMQNVIFSGELPHEEVVLELSKSRCYALTSLYESFGIALVESMVCGTPAVAFDVRVGPAYIIADEVDGYLIQNRDKHAFAKRLKELIEDPVLSERMGEKAIVSAARFFAPKVMVEWEKILKDTRK